MHLICIIKVQISTFFMLIMLQSFLEVNKKIMKTFETLFDIKFFLIVSGTRFYLEILDTFTWHFLMHYESIFIKIFFKKNINFQD